MIPQARIELPSKANGICSANSKKRPFPVGPVMLCQALVMTRVLWRMLRAFQRHHPCDAVLGFSGDQGALENAESPSATPLLWGANGLCWHTQQPHLDALL
eukprot:scaffold200440_cov22-Tisochrysis_lutea.AAC.1